MAISGVSEKDHIGMYEEAINNFTRIVLGHNNGSNSDNRGPIGLLCINHIYHQGWGPEFNKSLVKLRNYIQLNMIPDLDKLDDRQVSSDSYTWLFSDFKKSIIKWANGIMDLVEKLENPEKYNRRCILNNLKGLLKNMLEPHHGSLIDDKFYWEWQAEINNLDAQTDEIISSDKNLSNYMDNLEKKFKDIHWQIINTWQARTGAASYYDGFLQRILEQKSLIAIRERDILRHVVSDQAKQVQALRGDITQRDTQIGTLQGQVQSLPQKDAQIGTLQGQVQALRGDVTQRDGQIRTLQVDVSQRDGQILTLQADVAQRDGQIRTLQADVAQRDGQIRTLQADVAQRDGQIRTLQADVAQRDGQIRTLQADVAQRDGQIRNLQADVVQRDGLNRILQADVAQRDAQIRTLQVDVVQRDERIHILQADVVQRDAQIRTLQADVAQRDGQIHTLQADIVQRDDQIRTIQADVVQRDGLIRILQANIVQRDEQIHTLQATVVERDAQIEVSRVQLQGLETNKQLLEQQLSNEQAMRNQLNETIVLQQIEINSLTQVQLPQLTARNEVLELRIRALESQHSASIAASSSSLSHSESVGAINAQLTSLSLSSTSASSSAAAAPILNMLPMARALPASVEINGMVAKGKQRRNSL